MKNQHVKHEKWDALIDHSAVDVQEIPVLETITSSHCLKWASISFLSGFVVAKSIS